jgi:peroxiredoxin (alkyl hydroperoxide reductase subunit C)
MNAVARSVLVVGTLLSFAAPALGQTNVLETSARLPKMPLIGDKAIEFEAKTTRGTVRFPQDYLGKWVVLFSHPADFTPVCTSEFIAFAEIAGELAELNTELLGLSVDSVKRHKEWIARIESNLGQKISFPVVGDPEGEVAWSYGMIHPSASNEHTVRTVFIIDPKGVIRAMLYYPMESGRNTAEIKRMLIAMQTNDAHRVATPVNWQPGDKVLLPVDPKRPRGKADCKDWYYCEKSMPKSKLKLPKES